MEQNKLVREDIHLGNYTYKDTKHIVLCGDKDYLKFCGITMTSVFISNPDSNFEIHILCDDISNADLQRFKNAGSEYKASINIYKLDTMLINEFTRGVNTSTHINVATFFRIVAFKLLGNKVDRLLYLDSDILVTGNIAYFWEMELDENQYAIAIKDILEEQFKKKIKVEGYFNAGVIFMDLRKWNSKDYTAICIDNIKRNHYPFMDQDALNIVLDGKCLYFPKKYNYICDLGEIMNRVKCISVTDAVPASEDARIIHFCGRSKPWHSWVQDFSIAQRYMEIHRQSQWNDSILIRACDVKDKCYRYKYTRMEMKAAAKEGRYMQMFERAVAYMWYKLVYFFSKK